MAFEFHWQDLAQALGGVGVFLLGMLVMTEGLKALAGARISRYLVEATGSPWSGALTGALGTAILQSSSATTVAAVGFVAAGLLEFSQALGIIFGANLGTTITGWMVALLGFKLKLGVVAMPLVFLGVLLRLFASGRWARFGFALSGFGLIFIGIDLLQQAMEGYGSFFDPASFPPDSWSTRLRLMLLGIGITLVTQSSSAGVAAALVAIHAGVIDFEQAAALVIGMDVGTTVTAAMATIGGSIGARRTGLSHVIYNLFTGIGALLMISPFRWLLDQWFPNALQQSPEVVLVAFHSSFNALGVLLVLPFAGPFARFIERLVPETRSRFARQLDPSLLQEPATALDASRQALLGLYRALLDCIDNVLEQGAEPDSAGLQSLEKDLGRLQRFLDQIHIPDPAQPDRHRLTALLHATDHLQRLLDRCDEDWQRALVARRSTTLRSIKQRLDDSIEILLENIDQQDWASAATRAQAVSREIDDRIDALRDALYRQVAAGDLEMDEARQQAEALRWLQRVGRHLYRISYYLWQADQGASRSMRQAEGESISRE